MSRDIEELIALMTLDEKASLTTGVNGWATATVPRVGIPTVTVTDGPAGARGPFTPGIGRQEPSLCIPCGSALGATWNPELIEQLGEALGTETRVKACRVLLAPTVNLHRSPLGGRNFETYSEDPILAGKTAAAFIRGVQSKGVATTVKHFAGNEAEFQRMTIDSVIDERTLRELYLLPFELAIREGGSLGIMTGYNRLNGSYCAEHHELLHDILRGEWGFDGFVISDWYGVGSTVGSAEAGLDLEMPAPSRIYGTKLADAVRDGRVDESLLDDIVRRLLTVFDRIGAFDDTGTEPPASLDDADHRALAYRAATESMVLLKNDALLPLDPSTVRSIAVIGPNAERARIMGGGSAEVMPFAHQAPLEALAAAFGPGVQITYEQGCDIDRTVPPIDGGRLSDGFTVGVFDNPDWSGEPISQVRRSDGRVILAPDVGDPVPRGGFSFRASSRFAPLVSGRHMMTMIQLGTARVLLDGELILDGIGQQIPRGVEFFGAGSQEVQANVQLEAGRPYDLTVEFTGHNTGWACGAQVGCKAVPAADLIDRAVAAAAAADVAIVVVGTNNDWETEGHDRDSLDLPGEQAELIRRVAAANKRTVVVLNTGSPVTMDWVGNVGAVLQAWFGGMEMSTALSDVLVGRAEPCGRLPLTFPTCIEHTPSFGNFPGEHGQLRYGEGVLVGYRWYEARRLATVFPFGYGLSYTSFEIGAPTLPTATFTRGGSLSISVPVTNTGGRPGSEVVQVYVGAVGPRVLRPPKELKGFAKVHLEPGETASVTIELDDRSFAYWHPGDRYRSDHGPSNGIFTDAVRTPRTAGWQVDAGEYVVSVGHSSADIAHTLQVTVLP